MFHDSAASKAHNLALQLAMLQAAGSSTNLPSGNFEPGANLGSSFDNFSMNVNADMACGERKKTSTTTECVPVPTSEHVAEIVGRQGCKIKALRAKTNTYIKTPARGEEPVFIVTGTKEEVAFAKKEILSAADHFTNIRAARKNHINSTLALGQMMANTPGQMTVQVRVPYKVVGLVVGPKGTTIKRIQQQTHTYIVTPSRDKDPVFEVTGLPENVAAARREIESHIALRTAENDDDDDDVGVDFQASGFANVMNTNSLSRSSSVSSWNVDQPTSGLSYSDSLHMTNWFPHGVTLMDLLENDGLGMSTNPPKTSPFGTWNKTGSDSGFCSSPSLDGASSGSNDPGSVSLQKSSYKIWGDLNVDVDSSAISSMASTSRTPLASCWPDLTSLVVCAAGDRSGVAAAAALSAEQEVVGALAVGGAEDRIVGNDKHYAGTADITLEAEVSDVEELATEIQEKIHKLLDD